MWCSMGRWGTRRIIGVGRHSARSGEKVDVRRAMTVVQHHSRFASHVLGASHVRTFQKRSVGATEMMRN